MRLLRKAALALLPLALGGCTLVQGAADVTLGLLGLLLPIAVAAGGIALGVYLSNR